MQPDHPHSPYSIAMLLLPGFSSLSANAMVDPFRAANYLKGQSVYRWDWLGLDANPVVASNGLSIGNTAPYASHTDGYDLIVINASWAPERYNDAGLNTWLANHARRGSLLCGIDTGAFLLGYARLLDQYRATVHYEHIAAFKELFPQTDVSESLYVFDRNRISCCGGQGATDLALELIRHQQGVDLANAASRYIFHERLRGPKETQLSDQSEPAGYRAPSTVREAILLMERNLEDPLSLPEIASHTRLSQRQLARVFKQFTGVTPARYYADVRLDRARGLLTQTELSVAEIAAACGFGSAESFSRAYRKRFSLSPLQDRTAGRIPFQFRSFPGHGGLAE